MYIPPCTILLYSNFCMQKKHKVFLGAVELLKSKSSNINQALTINEQIESYVPYDERWEFPKSRLRMGSYFFTNRLLSIVLNIQQKL